MSKFTKLIISSIFIFGILFVSGCNTVAGFGQDMQAGGQALTNAADNHK